MKIFPIIGLVSLPHSPDIVQMVFSFWGYIRDIVDGIPAPDINTLRSQIQDAVSTITGEMETNTLGEKLNIV